MVCVCVCGSCVYSSTSHDVVCFSPMKRVPTLLGRRRQWERITLMGRPFLRRGRKCGWRLGRSGGGGGEIISASD